MRCLSRWLLAVGVATLIASPVMAHEAAEVQGRGGFEWGGPAGANQHGARSEELKLSDDKVTKAGTRLLPSEKFTEERSQLQDLDPIRTRAR